MNPESPYRHVPVVIALAIIVAVTTIAGYLVFDGRNRAGSGLPSPSSTLVAEGSPFPAPSGFESAPPGSPLASIVPSSIVPSGSPPADPTPSGPPRVRALAQREVFGFLPYWHVGDPATQIPLDTLTTIAIFGVEAGRDGHLVRLSGSGAVPRGWAAWNGSEVASLISRAHGASVRVVLTVQRFAWTAGEQKRTEALLTDPARRQLLAADIVSELRAKDADGVNLDFEPVPASVEPQFVEFVRELRAALDAARPGYQLTFDTTTDVEAWDLPALTADDAADAALLMGYDFRTAAAPVAGSVDPLVSISSGSLSVALDEAVSAIAPDRLILGLPWYGRAWSTVSADPQSATLSGRPYTGSATVEYAGAVALALQFGRSYDDIEQSAWTLYQRQLCTTCPVAWRQLWYDDVDGMVAKQSQVVGRGLRGLGIWALGQDGDLPDGWMAIRISLGGLVDSDPPAGTARVDPASFTRRHGQLPIVGSQLRLLLEASDPVGGAAAGSGVAFVRVATDGTTADDGSLVSGITYPQTASLAVPLADARLGASLAKGQQTLYVAWRDAYGNWSRPVTIGFWLSNVPSPSPSTPPSAEPTEPATVPTEPATVPTEPAAEPIGTAPAPTEPGT